MFRAIGLVVLIWYLSTLFPESFQALNSMLATTFTSLEAAVDASTDNFK